MSGVWHDGCYKRGGTVHQEGTVLTITLERPARPRWAQAVSDLLALINAQDPRHPAYSRYALQSSPKVGILTQTLNGEV